MAQTKRIAAIFKKIAHKFGWYKKNAYLCIAFENKANMVLIVQLVRASDCGSECRGFESH